jgi:preprotein translocase subunit SecA
MLRLIVKELETKPGLLQRFGTLCINIASNLTYYAWETSMYLMRRETPRTRLARMRAITQQINALEESVRTLTQEQMIQATQTFKRQIAEGTHTLDDILPQAFALVREAAQRTLGLRHYDVQLIGGIAMHQGLIAEMCTGEGKTLVATLPAYLNALSGDGVHIVTVNDYLAKRDCEWMGQIYEYLGLSVGCVTQFTPEYQKHQAYAADITHVTNNELGFDYLRDHMATAPEQLKQRSARNYAIIDEVDSILIDEARTPLIISGPSESSAELCALVDQIISTLKPDDYQKDEKYNHAVLTASGIHRVESILRTQMILQENQILYDPEYADLVHALHQSLKARVLYTKDVDYIVKDGEVVLVDEFTGRIMQGRRYSDGLHQAIEAKEGVEIKNESVTMASITYQSYFRTYKKLAGMTGTASTEAEEFKKIYNLDIMTIPTNQPISRIDHSDVLYPTNTEKIDAICALAKERHLRGQPILVGTSSISNSEEMSAAFTRAGIPHKTLNARNHEYEAQIVAEAGNIGAVTIATSMAGRGTDIKPGGSDEEQKQAVLKLGGLFVLVTERHESRRIDNQFRGRSGRQGDPGESIFFISLEDKLMRVFGTNDQLKAMFEGSEERFLSHPIVDYSIATCQKKVERYHYETRKHVLEYDEVLNEQRKIIYGVRQQLLTNTPASAAQWIFATMTEVLDETLIALETEPELARNHIQAVFGIEHSSLDPAILQHDILTKRILDTPEDLFVSVLQSLAHNRPGQTLGGRKAYEYIRAYAQIDTIKAMCLQALDRRWRDHITMMDNMKHQCQLQGYAQRNPLNLYKTEALPRFEQLAQNFKTEVCNIVINTQGGIRNNADHHVATETNDYGSSNDEIDDVTTKH